MQSNSIQVLFLLAVSAMLDAVYSAFGYRGESLLYMTALIIFIALMVWLYFNYRSIDIYPPADTDRQPQRQYS
ncbi:MAG: hypothetical protein E7190_11420 [Erysipelotrichaceae bacterium]|nr:hypothetical protein [Erysipelotrichaceae bacterium]